MDRHLHRYCDMDVEQLFIGENAYVELKEDILLSCVNNNAHRLDIS